MMNAINVGCIRKLYNYLLSKIFAVLHNEQNYDMFEFKTEYWFEYYCNNFNNPITFVSQCCPKLKI